MDLQTGKALSTRVQFPFNLFVYQAAKIDYFMSIRIKIQRLESFDNQRTSP